MSADIVGLSEVTPRWLVTIEDSQLPTRYPHRVVDTSHGSNGVMLLSRHPFLGELRLPVDLPALGALVGIGSLSVAVVTVQIPSAFESGLAAWRRAHYRLLNFIDHVDGPAIVMGDFNAVRHQRVMRALEKSGFVNAHRALRSHSQSWPAPLPILRLDHTLVRPPLTPRFTRDWRVPGSDHRGFVVEVDVIDRLIPRGVRTTGPH
jgi:endonuclease/exonuclease/phosphatase (EEP) superfamily protein YafD